MGWRARVVRRGRRRGRRGAVLGGSRVGAAAGSSPFEQPARTRHQGKGADGSREHRVHLSRGACPDVTAGRAANSGGLSRGATGTRAEPASDDHDRLRSPWASPQPQPVPRHGPLDATTTAPQGPRPGRRRHRHVIKRDRRRDGRACPRTFATDGTIQRASFGGADSAPNLAMHYSRAHEVTWKTLRGLKKDLVAFQDACRSRQGADHRRRRGRGPGARPHPRRRRGARGGVVRRPRPRRPPPGAAEPGHDGGRGADA